MTEQGDLAKAERYYSRSLDVGMNLDPQALKPDASVKDATIAITFNGLGLLASRQGDWLRAEEYFLKVLETRKRLEPGGVGEGQAYTNLGTTAENRGDLARAETYYRQSLQIYEKFEPGSLDVATSLTNLGDAAKQRGDVAQAERYFRQALAIEEKLAPDGLLLAETLQELGDVSRTADDARMAERFYGRALAILEKVAPGSRQHAESLAAVASILRDQQQFDAAANVYARAVTAMEQQTAQLGGAEKVRSGFRANHSHIYGDYAGLLLAQNQPEQAFEIVERSRVRTLLEMLLAARIDIRKGANPSLLERERVLQDSLTAKSSRRLQVLGEMNNEKQLAALTRDIEELAGQYQEVEERLRMNSPDYAALSQPVTLTAGQIQRELLDDDTLLLEYALGEEHSYVWVISRSHVAVHELARRSQIEGTAQKVYGLLTARNLNPSAEGPAQREARIAEAEAAYWNASAELSQLVLGPIGADIRQERLLVVTDGALQYVPLALLPTPRSFKGNALGMPLVAEHEITYLPSASVLAGLRGDAADRPKHRKKVVILADPVFSKEDARVRSLSRARKSENIGGGAETRSNNLLTRAAADLALPRGDGSYLQRLPFTQQEGHAIVAAVPAGLSTLVVGFEANRALATSPELANYQVVHFATHGLVDNEHPEFSGLVFSLLDRHAKPDNGFLSLQDIYKLKLPVDLVVLSACETGLGLNIRGEGLLGLTRGFMYAGASRVMASLWSVDDAATSELMRRFYKALFREGLTPPAALRKAQLEMSEQERWRSPYYWAGFILQGEWKAMPQ